MKNLLTVVLKICVSAGILYFLFRGMDMAAFWESFVSVNPAVVVLVAFIFVATQCVSAYRWSIILKKDLSMPYMKLLSIYYIGMFFNNFLPTIVGGDIIKGYYIYKASSRGDVSAASLFMDRYAGFTALMVLTCIALVPGYALIRDTALPVFFVFLIGGFFCGSLVVWVGPLHSWAMSLMSRIHFYGINSKIDSFYRMLMGYKGHPDILVKIFLCGLFVQGGVMTGYWILGRALGIEAGIGYYFLFIPLTAAISMVPISLAGLGLREGAFVYLFARAGASREQALTLSLMWFFIMVVVSIAGGVEYVRAGGRRYGAGGAEAGSQGE